MRTLRTIVLDLLIFILVNVLCLSLVSPSLMESAIQNDQIAQEMTHKVMTVINQYTYRLPEISLQKIESDISQSSSISKLTKVYSQAIMKQMATGQENKKDMTPYINQVAKESFSIIEKDSDITLPDIFKTTIIKLISSGLVSQGINDYVTEFIQKQSPKKLRIIRIIYQLTLPSSQMIMIALILILIIIQLFLDKLKGLRNLSVTCLFAGLCVAFIQPALITKLGSSYLEHTIVFETSLLRTPGFIISGISLIAGIFSQGLLLKKQKS